MADIETWEFYEELNEIVYVIDIDSYDLIYMNRKTRELYGIHSMEEVKGKKCYELFFESQNPCTFCNSSQLESGCFLEEMQYHPVFKRSFIRKQTMIEKGGRRYRFELAIDLSAWNQWGSEYEANAIMVNEGLRAAMTSHSPEESIAILLEYLGQVLRSERVYVFEESGKGTFDNTYEWCASGVIPQKENLQDVPFEVVSMWYQRFHSGESVIIKNLESIRDTDPALYDYLKPQNIHSLVVSPLVSEEKIIGFYGVDNPPEQFLGHITALFQILGYFMVSFFHRRNHVKKLEALCFEDQLTGMGNRHAMNEYIASIPPEKSIGILFCDVMGLKRANDTMGHQAGDNLLIRASECLRSEFKEYELFRVGGDEFLALCAGIEEKELLKKTEQIKIKMRKRNANMAMGLVWRPDSREDMDKLITQADNLMYEDKRTWYAEH